MLRQGCGPGTERRIQSAKHLALPLWADKPYISLENIL